MITATNLTDGKHYNHLIQQLVNNFGQRLKTVVLFGSRAREEAEDTSDHDLLLVIDRLPEEPVKRLKTVRRAIAEVPLCINTIAKTPSEVACNLTPLLLDVCVDGICLFGQDYFNPYRRKALQALQQSGLKRKREGRTWYWQFEQFPTRVWELTWDGYRELT